MNSLYQRIDPLVSPHDPCLLSGFCIPAVGQQIHTGLPKNLSVGGSSEPHKNNSLSEQSARIILPSVERQKREFAKLLDALSGKYHKFQVFEDFLEMSAIVLHQSSFISGEFPTDEYSDKLETDYLKVAARYTEPEQLKLAQMLSIVIETHNAAFYGGEFQDFLGDIAGEQELLNKWKGQFFTSYSLAKITAGITLGNVDKVINQKGLITIGEPASGGGAMVIAAAAMIYEKEYDPRATARFICTDVSRSAFNMTYIQLSALGLQGVVAHGNTLSGEMFEVRTTPQVKTFNAWLSVRLEQLKREERVKRIFAFISDPPDNNGLNVGQQQSETSTTNTLEQFSLDPNSGQGRLFNFDTPDLTLPKKGRKKRGQKRNGKPKGFSGEQGALF